MFLLLSAITYHRGGKKKKKTKVGIRGEHYVFLKCSSFVKEKFGAIRRTQTRLQKSTGRVSRTKIIIIIIIRIFFFFLNYFQLLCLILKDVRIPKADLTWRCIVSLCCLPEVPEAKSGHLSI